VQRWVVLRALALGQNSGHLLIRTGEQVGVSHRRPRILLYSSATTTTTSTLTTVTMMETSFILAAATRGRGRRLSLSPSTARALLARSWGRPL
jgi:hypothetical protein